MPARVGTQVCATSPRIRTDAIDMPATEHRVFIAFACSTLLHALLLMLPAKPPREAPIPRPLDVVIADATTADDKAQPPQQASRPRPVQPKRARRALEPAPPPESRPQPATVAPPPAPVPDTAQAPEPVPDTESTTPARARQPAPRREAAALSRYADLLAAALARERSYPRLARMRGMEGNVEMQLRIGADGQVLSAHILESSGHEVLDRQALAMIEKAQPLPKPPASLPGGELTVRVPVVFRLDG